MDYKVLLAAPLMALLVVASADDIKMPARWSGMASASSAGAYLSGRDAGVRFADKPSLTIKSQARVGEFDHAAAMQYVGTSGYEGKRIRFSGRLKTSGITGWAGIWASVDDRGLRNFEEPRSSGTALPPALGVWPGDADWHLVSVVVDVPPGPPGVITMGLALIGGGQAWLGDLRFDEVGVDVEPTASRLALDLDKMREQRKQRSVPGASRQKAVPYNLALDP